MKGILLISHGELAHGMANTVAMFESDLSQFATCVLNPSEGPDDFIRKAEKALQEVDTGDGVIVFADLFGGTPFNTVCGSLLDKADIVTGFNLSMILDTLAKRDTVDFKISQIIHAGQEAIVDGKALMMQFVSDEED